MNKMTKVLPIQETISLCAEGLSLISDITEHAPFGIGVLFKSIEVVLSTIKQYHENNLMINQILKDIITLIIIIKKIATLPESNYVKMSINILTEDIDNFKLLYDKINVSEVKSCMFSKNYNKDLLEIRTRFGSSKLTLNMSLTANLSHNPIYLIPDTTTKAACPGITLDSPKQNQCMLINQKTDQRCLTMFPKYKIVSIKGLDDEKLVYYCCGHCVPDKKGAWWRKSYRRCQIVSKE